MNISRSSRYSLPPSKITPETTFWNRRAFLRGLALVAGGAALSGCGSKENVSIEQTVTELPPRPSDALYPAARNGKYQAPDRTLTPVGIAGRYNNSVDSFSIHELPKPNPLLRFTVTVCHHPVITNSISSGEKKTLKKVCNRRNHRFISSFEQGIVRRKAAPQTLRSHYISTSECVGRYRYRALFFGTSGTGEHPDQRSKESCIRSALDRSKTW